MEGKWKEIREWANDLIKEKVGVVCKVASCRESSAVIIVKLESEEVKREIMKNKYKLKGDRIFIENDLSWAERKVQVRINRWVKERKEKGLEVKARLGRVRIKGIWRLWSEVKREEEEGINKDRENGVGKEEKEGDRCEEDREQNFD